MKRFTFNVLFYIRRTRLNKNGMAPVMMRITKNGGSVESSISRSILPSHWDTHRNRSFSKGKECRELNAYLEMKLYSDLMYCNEKWRLRVLKLLPSHSSISIKERAISLNIPYLRFSRSIMRSVKN